MAPTQWKTGLTAIVYDDGAIVAELAARIAARWARQGPGGLRLGRTPDPAARPPALRHAS